MNSCLASHQHIGHTETGPRFKVSRVQGLSLKPTFQDSILCFNVPKTCLEKNSFLTLLQSERPKLHRVLAVLSAIGLNHNLIFQP